MNNYEKLLIGLAIFCVGIIIFIGLANTLRFPSLPAWNQSETLVLTQNSEFVVKNVRADSTGWEYTFKNLQSTPKITILQVETDQPVGYAIGDTLKLLNHKDKY